MARIRKLSWKTKLAAITGIVTILMLLLVTPSFATTVNTWGPAKVVAGQNLGFHTQINIYTEEQVPIDYIRVDMSGAGSAYVKFNPNGHIIRQSGGFSIEASYPAPGQGFGYCNNGGYGYGYSVEGGYHQYDWFSMCLGYGYGYGEEGYHGGTYPGVISLIYNLTFDTTDMPLGTYNAYTAAHLNPSCHPDPMPDFFTPGAPYTFLIGLGGGGGGGGGGEFFVEDSIGGSDITDNGADIHFTTYQPGSSQVAYSASPWLYSKLDTALVKQHVVHLTNLKPDTTYKYYCLSRDSGGFLWTSTVNYFKTLAAPEAAPPEETPPAPPKHEAPPTAPPTEEAPPPAAAPIAWWIWVIVGVVVVGIVVGIVVARRRAA
jgi:hypothetical protein